MSGIISHHYYLCGRDDNDKWKGYQMEDQRKSEKKA